MYAERVADRAWDIAYKAAGWEGLSFGCHLLGHRSETSISEKLLYRAISHCCRRLSVVTCFESRRHWGNKL